MAVPCLSKAFFALLRTLARQGALFVVPRQHINTNILPIFRSIIVVVEPDIIVSLIIFITSIIYGCRINIIIRFSILFIKGIIFKKLLILIYLHKSQKLRLLQKYKQKRYPLNQMIFIPNRNFHILKLRLMVFMIFIHNLCFFSVANGSTIICYNKPEKWT